MQVEFKVLGGPSHKIPVEGSETVRQVKDKVAAKLGDDESSATLVYKGKVLPDDETMEGAKISEGATVHVVKRKAAAGGQAAPAGTSNAGPSTNAPSQTMPGAGGMPNLFGNAGLGALGGLGGLPQGLPNPEMISKMMQDPQMQQMMQSVLSNPQMMVDMLQNNPMLRNLANNNPMIRESMANPDLMRTMFSPEALQSAMDMMSSLGGAGGASGLDLSSLSGLLGAAQPAADSSDARPAAEKYKDQAQLLKDMGFLEEEANLKALQHTGGNLDEAISKLLEEGHGN